MGMTTFTARGRRLIVVNQSHGRHARPQPPAKGGSTSITAPSSSTIDSLAARPTGSAFTRKDDRAMTSARRLPGFLLATTALSASRRVTASTDSSGSPAASFAAAQYLMVTRDISVILFSTGPRAVLPPGSLVFIQRGTGGP